MTSSRETSARAEPTSAPVAGRLADMVDRGYTLFPAFLSASIVARVRELALAQRRGDAIYMLGGDWLELHPEIVLPITAATSVLDVAEGIMGPFVQLDSFSVIGVPVDCPLDVEWHRDPYGAVPRGDAFQRPLALNLLIYLQDTDDRVGPLRVIPGSHRRGLELRDDTRHVPHPDEELVRPRSGDAVLLHNNLVHSRTRNRSPEDRLHVSVLYNLTCMRSTVEMRRPELQGLMQQIEHVGDPRLLRLFGEDQNGVERYNCGFLLRDEEMWAAWIDRERGRIEKS